jgi:Flp pilus assembly protein TadD
MRSLFVNIQFVIVCTGFYVAVEGQPLYQDRLGADAGRVLYEWQLRALSEPAAQAEPVITGPLTVSADLLRYPLSSKARHELEQATHQIDLGNHQAAIEDLQKTMVKYPRSVPYAYNLLGREYIESRQYVKAQESFAEAARLMPHESAPHSNLGLAFLILGQWERAEKELRKALQLDRANAKAKQILEMLKVRKLSKAVKAKADAAR